MPNGTPNKLPHVRPGILLPFIITVALLCAIFDNSYRAITTGGFWDVFLSLALTAAFIAYMRELRSESLRK